MTTLRLPKVLPAAMLTAAVACSTLTACTGSVPAGSTSVDYSPGTVVRVIDGDTLVINFDGEDQTVRLLNVDTPETKHPDKPVECLGVEATERLEALTPPGTEVALDFDVERTDQYDRVLAAVFVEDFALVNAEIARAGLGVPILIEPNSKYYDAVQSAYDEATAQGVGLLDPEVECTLPAEVGEVLEVLAAATAAPAGNTESAAGRTASVLVAALATAKAVRAGSHAGKDTVRVLAIGTDRGASMLADLDRRIAKGEQTLTATNSRVEELRKAKTEAKAKRERAEAAAQAERERAEAAAQAEREQAEAEAKAERERVEAEAAAQAERERAEVEARRVAEDARAEVARIQAEAVARAEADRLAAKAAERDRIANLPPAPTPFVRPTPAPFIPPVAPYVPPVPPAPAPPAADNPYPGYNGPRCYAPGGKTWRPC